MPTQDTSQIKAKILQTFKIKGPSLPVHIAKEIGVSILFASAFLSELTSEKKLKVSSMKVGSSPVYFIPGQEPQLEKFSQHLKSKEKDAFILLKEKKFLKDKEQQPAIRVALRAIKDFAIPFKQNNEIFWKYLTAQEKQLQTPKPKIIKPIVSPALISSSPAQKKYQDLNIFDKQLAKQEQSLQEKIVKTIKKTTKRKTSSKQNEKFFNKVKEFLKSKSITVSEIISFSKSDLVLKVREQGAEKLIVAYNKKRIIETDIINAHKKAEDQNLPHIILSLGEPSKKLVSFIRAVKKLEKMDKMI